MTRSLALLALIVATLPAVAQEGTDEDPSVRPFPRGVTADTARAVEAGVRYLVSLQNANGSWLSEGNQGQYPSAMTSLAGMALLAAGHTSSRGAHARAVDRAIRWLLTQQSADGVFTGPGEMRNMYGHGFSMLFLGSAYGDIADRRLQDQVRVALEKAIQLTVRAQSEAGGWYYTPEDRNDEGSVTVTQMQGLRACRNAGIDVPEKAIKGAVAYLKLCQMDDGGICYSAKSRGGSRPAISAAAVACMYSAGAYDDPIALKCLAYCKRTFRDQPADDGFYFYTNFYWAQALYQLGGEDWDRFYPKLCKSLLTTHRQGAGWTENGFGGTGVVLGTSMALIMLTLPYNHVPIFQR